MGDLGRINTNVAALRSFITLTGINDRISLQQRQISTGLKVNSASDDPAIYFASKKTRRDINALANKETNIERGINFLETNSSKLDQISEILLEMYTLANTANSGAVSSAEKQSISRSMEQLRLEVENLLLSGISKKIYTGFTMGGLENVNVSGAGNGTIYNTLPTLNALNIESTDLIVTGSTTETSIKNLSNAIDAIVKDNQVIGAYVKRLRFEIQDIRSEKTNLQATYSTIANADIAEAQMELTKLQILQQSALAMLAQANAAPQAILVLFR